jgi:hypothetical protein
LVNRSLKKYGFLWVLLPCAVVLILAAWLRGAEYDEQYTLFLTSGVPRPDWPVTVFPAGVARDIQAGHAGLIDIARDLRTTDVHPPLYFWLVSIWRDTFGNGLLVARLLSVTLGLGALALTGVIARLARIPPVWAMLLTLGCYGFTYTSVVARGFSLAQLLLMGGVAGLLLGRRFWHFVLAGALLGAATMSNYLSAFCAGACLLAVGLDWAWPHPHRHPPARPHRHPPARPGDDGAMTRDDGAPGDDAIAAWDDAGEPPRNNATAAPGTWHQPLGAVLGFLAFIPADLWWFLAQRGTRLEQFPPFSLGQSLTRLAVRFAGDLLGGLPLYVGGTASLTVTAALGLLLMWLLARIAWRWRDIGTPRARIMFALGALAPASGLLALGAVFNNTPIEIRYLSFSTPFVALLLAGALRARGAAVLLAVQAASIVGLMLAPQTMQPARAAAHLAAELVEGGVVLLPRGNDGVGVVGAFAIEAPPSLPLLLIAAADTPEQIRFRIGAWRRVVLALLEQDAASRAASDAMRRAMRTSMWREVAHGPNVAVYERIDDRG